ncbi:deoxyribodipyrimidine photo-lyase [Janibacter sp. DB-40]|uniref:cryptochrome/photolyase family protein n=1 Tax=Janibacter sp. DB-40 TaxID=3028808 RepID=UPI00240655F1|nr:deoxyribodipyrimidine photo-lyase [Janibacter sp. DB-40]
MSTSLLWFRRDLRLGDHPALCEAAARGEVLPLFVIDPSLWKPSGGPKLAWLAATLRHLDESLGGRLVIRLGDPVDVVPRVAREVEAGSVHVSRENEPYGLDRDRRVVAGLQEIGVEGVATGSPFAVDPGTLTTKGGTPFKVFTPFARAWLEHGWAAPLAAPTDVRWAEAASDGRVAAMIDKAIRESPIELPDAGEEAALRRWADFRDGPLTDYDGDRDRPDRDGTSRMSADLHLGVVHPRQLLADLAGRGDAGARAYRTELAWREFYADVLLAQPESAWHDLRPLAISYDEPEDAIAAWREGRTGYPFVDAGMRQLLTEGWMHNRVRMVTASFLTKDLHVWWPTGARHFLEHLVDGDLASNNHGWQWVAGTGTDAAPYFRVFNPVTQGQRFDPDGDYVRRWVPELAHLPGKAAHEPWKHDDGYAHDYPRRIVDHAEERSVALQRYEAG